jgi:hypothetical protein
VTGPASQPPQANPASPTATTDGPYLYEFRGQAQTAAAEPEYDRCPADSPVPYTLTATAETLLGEPGSPTAPLPKGHSCGMSARPAQPGPGPAARPATYVTEIFVPTFDDGIHRLHARMKEPEPEPEAGA